MSIIDDAAQNIKGKIQKVEGDIQQNTGSPIKGTINKIKGEFNEKSSDAKMNTRSEEERLQDDTI